MDKIKNINKLLKDITKQELSLLSLFFKSYTLIIRNPILIIYIVMSILLTGIFFIGVFILAYYGHEYLLDMINNWLGNNNWVSTLQWFLRIILTISFIFIAYFTFSSIGLLISIPMLDLISEKVEIILTGKTTNASFLKGLIESVKSAVFLTIKKIFILIITLPLLFIPILGHIVFFIINSWSATYEFVDIPMARRGWGYKRKKDFLNKNCSKRERLIFGLIIYSLLLVPLLNLLVYPVGAVAGTMYFLKLSMMND